MEKLFNHQRAQRTTGNTLAGLRKAAAAAPRFPFLGPNVVPEGEYISKIVAVKETQTAKGAAALDIHYKLTDADGRVYTAKERHVVSSGYVSDFLNAMAAAGVPDDAELKDIIGVKEKVLIDYSATRGYGAFADREPCDPDEDAGILGVDEAD